MFQFAREMIKGIQLRAMKKFNYTVYSVRCTLHNVLRKVILFLVSPLATSTLSHFTPCPCVCQSSETGMQMCVYGVCFN